MRPRSSAVSTIINYDRFHRKCHTLQKPGKINTVATGSTRPTATRPTVHGRYLSTPPPYLGALPCSPYFLSLGLNPESAPGIREDLMFLEARPEPAKTESLKCKLSIISTGSAPLTELIPVGRPSAPARPVAALEAGQGHQGLSGASARPVAGMEAVQQDVRRGDGFSRTPVVVKAAAQRAAAGAGAAASRMSSLPMMVSTMKQAHCAPRRSCRRSIFRQTHADASGRGSRRFFGCAHQHGMSAVGLVCASDESTRSPH